MHRWAATTVCSLWVASGTPVPLYLPSPVAAEEPGSLAQGQPRRCHTYAFVQFPTSHSLIQRHDYILSSCHPLSHPTTISHCHTHSHPLIHRFAYTVVRSHMRPSVHLSFIPGTLSVCSVPCQGQNPAGTWTSILELTDINQ